MQKDLRFSVLDGPENFLLWECCDACTFTFFAGILAVEDCQRRVRVTCK